MPVRRGLREDGAKDSGDADEDEGVHSLVGPVVGAIKARKVSERGSSVSPEHVAPVSPGMPRRCPEPREQPSRAMGMGRGHGLGWIRCCTGASALADDSEGAARTAFSAATGRAEAHSAAGCIYLAGSSVRVAEVKPVQCWRRRSGVDGQSGWRGLGSGLGLGLGSL